MPLDNNSLNINYSTTRMRPILSLQSMQQAEGEMCFLQPWKYFYFLQVLFGLTRDTQKEMHSHK